MSDVSDLPIDTTDDSPVALDDASTIVADNLTIDTDPEPYVMDDVSVDDYPPTSLDDTSIGDDETTADSAVLPANEDFVPQTQIHLGDDGQLVDTTPAAGEQPPDAPAGAINYDGTTPIPAEHNPIGGPIPQDTVSLPAEDGPPTNGDGPLMPGDIGAAVPPSGDTTTAPPGPVGGTDPTAVQTTPPFPGSDADHSNLPVPEVDSGSPTGDPTGAPIIGSITGDADTATGPGTSGVPTGDTTTTPPGTEGGDDPTAVQTTPPVPGSDADHSNLTMPVTPESTVTTPEPGDRIGPFDATKLPPEYLEKLAHDPTGVSAEQLVREWMREDGHDPDAYLAADPTATNPATATDPATAADPATAYGAPNPAISTEQGIGLLAQLTGPASPEVVAQLQGAVLTAAGDGTLTVSELAGIVREHSADFGMGASAPATAATAAGITQALDEGRSVFMFVERDTTTTTTSVHDTPVELATFRAFDAQASTFTLDTDSGEQLEMHADDLSKWLTAVGLNAPAGPAGPVVPVDTGDGGGMSGLQMVGIGAGVLVPAAAGAALLARRRRAQS